jgi:hypothetical protein
MTVRKGLSTLIDIDPNFSDQAMENAVNGLKQGWVIKSLELDNAITNNVILTTSQKTDVKDTINNIAYLNLGRTLGDLLRHTDSIIDGSILPIDQDVNNPTPGTFKEILGSVQSLQGLIPFFYGVPATSKSKGVNDHLGTLNNLLLTTDDSTQPAFTQLREGIEFITAANLATETALETAYDDLKAHIDSMTDDSTDTQHRSPYLIPLAQAVATAHTNFNNALASEPYLTKRNQLLAGREKVNTQVSLENTNLVGIRNYIQSLVDVQTYAGLASNQEMASLLAKVAQAPEWREYYENYEENFDDLNPIYTTSTDSDKSAIIDQVYTDSGLPDVRDPLDLIAVANKAKRDPRIDTAGFDPLTAAQVITKSCEQLGITTANRTIYTQSETLLNNMNQEDRDRIARALDLNESSNTLS